MVVNIPIYMYCEPKILIVPRTALRAVHLIIADSPLVNIFYLFICVYNTI